MERLTQKGTAYKVPGAEEPGQKMRPFFLARRTREKNSVRGYLWPGLYAFVNTESFFQFYWRAVNKVSFRKQSAHKCLRRPMAFYILKLEAF